MKKVFLIILILIANVSFGQVIQMEKGWGIGPGMSSIQINLNGVFPSEGLIFRGSSRDVILNGNRVVSINNKIIGRPTFKQDTAIYQPIIGTYTGIVLDNGAYLRLASSAFDVTNIASMTIIYKGLFYGTAFYYNMFFGRADSNGGSEGVIWLQDAMLFPKAEYLIRSGSNTTQGLYLQLSSNISGIFGFGFDSNNICAFNSTSVEYKSQVGPVVLYNNGTDWVIGSWPLRPTLYNLQAEITDILIYNRLLTPKEITKIRRCL